MFQHATPLMPRYASEAAFVLLLLSPCCFPGFFPFDVNLWLAVAATLLLFGTRLYCATSLRLPRLPVLALILAGAIQAIHLLVQPPLAPESGWLAITLCITALIMLIIGAGLRWQETFRWLHLFLGAAVIWSLIGLYIWLGGSNGLPLSFGLIAMSQAPAPKLAGPFIQGNVMATIAGMALLLSLWLWLKEKRSSYALITLFFTMILTTTLSRGGWISWLPAIATLVIIMRPPAPLLYFRLIPCLLAGIATGMLLSQFSVSAQAGALFPLVDTAATSMATRISIWATAINIWLHVPLTGVGPGQFGAAFWEYYPQAAAWLAEYPGLQVSRHGIAMSSHSLPLQLLAEGGIAAFVLFMMAIWIMLKLTIQMPDKAVNPRLPFALIALAFLLQSLINISFVRPLPLLLFALFAGIAFAPWLNRQSWRIRIQSPHRLATLALCGLLAADSGTIVAKWFQAADAIARLELNDKQRVAAIAAFHDQPRIGAIPLTWLGYQVAATGQHLPLLTWMTPGLAASQHEIPWADVRQVLFYAQAWSGQAAEACKTGQGIERMNFIKEQNGNAYSEICTTGKLSRSYHFGH